jgi:hypothetical protein
VLTYGNSSGLASAKICVVDPDKNEATLTNEVMLSGTADCRYISPNAVVDPATGYMAWLYVYNSQSMQSATVDVSGDQVVVVNTATHFSDAAVASGNNIPMVLDPVSNRFLALYLKTSATTGTQVLVGSLSSSGQVSMTVGGVISIFKYDDGRVSDSGGYKKALEYHPPSKSFISVTHQYGWRNAAEINVKTLTIVQMKISPQTGGVEIGEPLIFEGIDDIDHSSLCYYPPAKKLSLHLESKKPSRVTQYATIDVVDDVVTVGDFNDFVDGWNANQAYDPVTKRNVLSAKKTSDSKIYDALQTYGFFDGNLTENNFIGVSKGDYSDGEDATVQVSGINSDQQGLVGGTAYYVQPDGSLSTSEGKPSVFAGTAIGPTKLNIKA